MRVVGSLLFTLLLPIFSCAATLVNINTANAALLDTLPGIGPSKANAIITYRNEHGPFARIEDIQNVSGIGPSTYADIAPLITVGDPEPPAPPDPVDSSAPTETATTTQLLPAANSGQSEYLPIPELHIVTSGGSVVSSGADVAFKASVYDSKGNKRDDAIVTWSFGDGMKRIGADVFHFYYESGEYLAVVHATTSDGGDASEEMVITVKDASIKIASVSSRGITLANDDSRTLDLSLWRLSMGGQEFKIPEDTQILVGRTILFPSRVIELPIADSALLLYPSGEVAATYPSVVAIPQANASTQPSPNVISYNQVQKVEPIISKQANVPVYEDAVSAPATTTELAAAGAALPSLLKSPWTLGFIGTMILAGMAFILI